MMPARLNLIGKRFGRLTVLGDDTGTAGTRRRVIALCDCGSSISTDPRRLRNGRTKSCGCLQREIVRASTIKTHTTHNMSRSSEYNTWAKMKGRCYNEKDKKFHDYGGRGIYVCEEWKNDFNQFLADMGNKPSIEHSIDRIDVNGPYSPENCRWATPKQQSENRRCAIKVPFEDEFLTLSVACDKAGINYRTALYRVNKGLPWNWRPLPPPPVDAEDITGAPV